jgi:hypothetical protein
MGPGDKDNKPKGAKNSKSLLVEKDRGTQDDVEVLKQILDENPALRQRVIERIKVVRKMSKL